MSEKLIDHEFDNDGDEDNHDHCWRHVTSFGNGDCGMPRSRHRQAEKAQDFGEPWSVQPERGEEHVGDFIVWARDGFDGGEHENFVANVDDNRGGRPVAFDLSQERAERIIASVNACAGVPDPQPVELASLRHEIRAASGVCGWGGPCGKPNCSRVACQSARADQAEADLAAALNRLLDRASKGDISAGDVQAELDRPRDGKLT